MALIPAPQLDSRDGEQLAAEAIARTSGGLTVEYLNSKLEVIYRLIALVQGGALDLPICPELTSANPSDPHVVLLEAQAWLAEQLRRVLNVLPEAVRIEFANLFVEMRDATAATTTLQFTATGSEAVTIPAGTQVQTSDGKFIFATDAETVIANPAVNPLGTVAATRTELGPTLLAPDTLTELIEPIANVSAVTNPAQVDSGTSAEAVTEALVRASQYVRYGERWVSGQDVEEGILNEVLFGNGLVRAFDLVKYPDWNIRSPGYTTIVVATRAGNAVSDEIKAAIQVRLRQRVGHIQTTIIDSQSEPFNVVGTFEPDGVISSDASRAAAERRLREFYSPTARNFGRHISRSDIIRIADLSGLILSEPAADIPVAPYKLPRLDDVDLTPAP